MADIFLAYSRVDSSIATALASALREQGWSVFMDVQTRTGERWDQALLRELNLARAVAVLWSKASVESEFVLDEADRARKRRVLFPAFIERVEYPYGFSRIQTVDLVGWQAHLPHTGFAQLVDSLRATLTTAAKAKPKTDKSKRPAEKPKRPVAKKAA